MGTCHPETSRIKKSHDAYSAFARSCLKAGRAQGWRYISCLVFLFSQLLAALHWGCFETFFQVPFLKRFSLWLLQLLFDSSPTTHKKRRKAVEAWSHVRSHTWVWKCLCDHPVPMNMHRLWSCSVSESAVLLWHVWK